MSSVDACVTRDGFPAVDLGRSGARSSMRRPMSTPTVREPTVHPAVGSGAPLARRDRTSPTCAVRPPRSSARCPTSGPSRSWPQDSGRTPSAMSLPDEPAPERAAPECALVERDAVRADQQRRSRPFRDSTTRGPHHVHRRCADELGDEEVARMVVHVDRDPTLLDAPVRASPRGDRPWPSPRRDRG